MQLTKSLSQIKGLTGRARMGTPDIYTGEPDPAPVRVQGTRSFMGQGTQIDVADPLTGRSEGDMERRYNDVASFNADKPVIPGAPGTIVQTTGWPANPSISINGNPSADRAEQSMMSGDLQTGAAPGRIWRGLPERNMGGASGTAFGQQAIGPGFPWNGDMNHIDHQWTARQALGTKGPNVATFDDNAVIPGVYAGSPKS